MTALEYGFLIVTLGISLMLLTYIIVRVSPRLTKSQLPKLALLSTPDVKSVSSAVLIVEPGGKIAYSNELAREWFGYLDGKPNLERLAQRTQPEDAFLGLCFMEGQARFTLDGRFVEGVSYRMPYYFGNGHTGSKSADTAMLVSLSLPKINLVRTEGGQVPLHAADILTQLSQNMNSNLDLEATLFAILESVERLIPSDLGEITVWDPINQNLIPYRFSGSPGEKRHLELLLERFPANSGYSNLLVTQHQPLFMDDLEKFRNIGAASSQYPYPILSFIGVPLLAGNEFLGTLELASRVKKGFTNSDFEVLSLLSGPASVALNNALRFKEEQKRVAEFSGLARLSRVMDNSTDNQDLFSHLVHTIADLVDVKILGFLIYRESHHLLEAQAPFRGIPEQLIELYRVKILPGSPAEVLFLQQEKIVAKDAFNDPGIKLLGLDSMAVASGIIDTVLLPLKTPSRILGYMQVADRQDGLAFDQETLRLLEIITTRAAAIIENAMLVKESQARAQRSETLRRVASLASSSATLDEIFTHSLRELTRLLRADCGLLFILDEYLGELSFHKPSQLVPAESLNAVPERLSITDPRFQNTVTGLMQSIFLTDLENGPEIPEFYDNMLAPMHVRSALIIPFIVRGQGVGEMLLGSTEESHFDQNDLTLVSTTTSQLSIAIEKAALYGQTDERLRRRVVQLLALNRIGRELNITLELERLLRVVFEQVVQTTEADCGSILLFDTREDSQTFPRITFQVGDAGTGSMTPVEMKVLRAGEPYIVKDYLSPDPSAPDTMPIPPHSGVRSSLIVPIAFQDYVAGLIHLHGNAPEHFDETSREIAQSLAVQAAIAIGNAQRYQEQQIRNEMLNRRVETLTALLETTKDLHAGQPLEESLETIAYGIQSATPFEIVLISVYDPSTKNLHRTSGAGIPLDTLTELRVHQTPWDSIQQLLQPKFLNSRSYFIPGNHEIDLPSQVHIEQILPETERESSPGDVDWHSDDLLLVPLYSYAREPLGLISVDAPRNGLRPDRPSIESLEIFANQAALVVETYQNIKNLADQSNDLVTELHDNRFALQTMQVEIPRLRQQNLDMAGDINNLSLRLRRLLASLETADKVDQLRDRDEILLTLARQIQTSMSMDIVLVAELYESGPRLVHLVGEVPASVSAQTLLGQRNPLRTCLQSGEAIYNTDLEIIGDWKNSPLLNALGARSFVCFPVLYDLIDQDKADQPKRIDSVVLAIRAQVMEAFDRQDEDVLALVSRQVTISLQNLRLIDETNRRLKEMNMLLEFSRQSGSFDTATILTTLVEGVLRVIPAAQAGMAAVWSVQEHALQPVTAQGYVENEKILRISYLSGQSLPGKAFALGKVMCPKEVIFAQDYQMSPEQLLLYRDATQGRLPISTLIVPLKTFDLVLGVLVLDNFRESAAFSQDDQNLVAALARQTALTLENIHLYQSLERRAAQLQTLTRVAGTITSSLQSQDLIHSLLDQVRSVVPFDTGILWLRQGNKMTVRAANGFSDNEERVGISVALEDSLLLGEMAATNQPLSVSDVRKDERFPAMLEHAYLSWLGVPLLSKGDLVGVMVLEKTEASFYDKEDIQAMVTFSSQASVALENANLYEDSLRRAEELDARSKRLTLLNRLSSELSASLDLERILSLLANEMRQATNAAMVSVALVAESGQIVVQTQEPASSLNLPYTLPENPVLQHISESLGIFTTEDILQEDELSSLKEFLLASATLSLLIVPLVSGNRLMGLCFIHSQQSYRFNPDEVVLTLTISNQVAVALQNARLFRETERLFGETQQRSSELAALFDLGVRFTQVLDQTRLLDITFDNVTRLIQPDAIMVLITESDDSLVAHIFDHHKRQEPIQVPRHAASFSEYVMTSSQPLLIVDTHAQVKPVAVEASGDLYRCWLGVPLVVRGRISGVISVQSDQAHVFGEAQLRLLSQIANQLSVALDNAHLFQTVQNYTAELEKRVSERTEQVAREHRRIQTLLSITTELSASLDLDLVLNRTLTVLNETIESEQSSILLIQLDSSFLFLRAALGYAGSVPQSGQISKIRRSEGLAGWVIDNQQSLLVDDLHEDQRWQARPDRTNLHRSAMVVPLMVGEDILGVLMVYHRHPQMFNADQLDLVQAVAKQIAISINNTQLYSLIRDQAERLGDMLRTQHIETSRSQAILEAVADGVLVTDARRKITLFNASAESILGLSRQDVLGQSLENFTGLFGKAAQSWVQTIRTWSEDPDAYLGGEGYEAQINLDNHKVVSVHLAPVHLHNDFLGTVSIFRDISHQVEVNRLKSEFVATVSHELRTPMTSIKGYVDILLLGAAGQLNSQQAHFLEIVKGNTERLTVLVNDLLDVSRIEAGKVTLSIQPIDLRPVIDNIIDSFKRRMEQDKHRLVFNQEIPSDLPLIHGDLERVRQILDNIIENAYQYTPVGGQIWVSLQALENEVQIDVSDNGIGIQPEERDRVFERFYRGEDPLVLASSGTGLGLAIVQTLVNMHGGRLWFKSEGIQGLGSVFSFTLPIHDPDQPRRSIDTPLEPAGESQPKISTRVGLEQSAEDKPRQDNETDDGDFIIGLEAIDEVGAADSTSRPASTRNRNRPERKKDDDTEEDWMMN